MLARHAGAAELDRPPAGRGDRPEIVLARAVEARPGGGDLAAHQPVDPDDPVERIGDLGIEAQQDQVVEERVEVVPLAPRRLLLGRRPRAHLLDEHPVAQPLRAGPLRLGLGELHPVAAGVELHGIPADGRSVARRGFVSDLPAA